MLELLELIYYNGLQYVFEILTYNLGTMILGCIIIGLGLYQFGKILISISNYLTDFVIDNMERKRD